MADQATQGNSAHSSSATGSLSQAIDHWIYVFMAAFFVVVTLTGFVPDSIAKVAAINADQRPPFPMILHVHAVLMGSFLGVLFLQTILAATGRIEYHRRLGVAGGILAIALVVAGFILVPTMFHQFSAMAQNGAANGVDTSSVVERISNVMLLQLRVGILFSLFVGIALAARKTNPGVHKRMMFLAIATALPAAFHRIPWLPNTLGESGLSAHLYILLAISPMLVWDLIRSRSLHKAYVIWLAIFVPSVLLIDALWSTEWWLATAPRLVGA